jgi:hypothetical protein
MDGKIYAERCYMVGDRKVTEGRMHATEELARTWIKGDAQYQRLLIKMEVDRAESGWRRLEALDRGDE